MKRALLAAVVLAASMSESAAADERPFRDLPAPAFHGAGGISRIAAGGPGEVWAAGLERRVCVEIPLPPLGTTGLCSADGAVRQWAGGRWVDRKPPGAWMLNIDGLSYAAPTNVWLSGKRVGVTSYARWDGTRWNSALFSPDCVGTGKVTLTAVGSGDEAWGVSDRAWDAPCVIRYEDGAWKSFTPPPGGVIAMKAATADDLWFEVGGTADVARRIMRWDGTGFAGQAVPEGYVHLLAAGAGVVYLGAYGDIADFRRVENGVVTTVPAAPDYPKEFDVDAEGTLFAFGWHGEAWRFDGTAWRTLPVRPDAYIPGNAALNAADLSPTAPGEVWMLNTGVIATNT
ncbi:MAG: hypothetical protein ABIS86_13805 [Streptosporangiaceae bacterium]